MSDIGERVKKIVVEHLRLEPDKVTEAASFQMIDDFFAAEVDIVERGISRRVSNFEAIVLQLLIQAIAGKKRAMNVLLQYQEFAARRSGGMGGTTLYAVVREDASPGKPGGHDGGAGK